jgi:probable rRNA maturation factor|tara:strand:+ start:1540 stop:1986 length:447 start_codon:yes stop_codon:yes gene_type:complete
MIKANVVLDNPIWGKKIKKPNNYIKKRLTILSKLSPFKNKIQEFTLFLTNSRKMKDLNNKFRKKNKATDVLSFPFNYKITKNSYLGDMAISYEIINKRSIKSNFFIEFDKMWIHGYLHLLGYDHKKLKNFQKMNKKENLILNYFYKKN